MNTANLQLEGLYAVVAAVLVALDKKQVFAGKELEDLLEKVETQLRLDPQRSPEMRDSNIDAICFPARFLRQALAAAAEGVDMSFSELTSRVGKAKDHPL